VNSLRTPRNAAPAVAALAAALLLSGCSGDSGGGSGVRVDPPRTAGRAAAQCAALLKALPPTFSGMSARTTVPASDATAAWGDPAITLRCGVPRPGVVDPASSAFDPNYQRHDAEELGGVCWVGEPTADKGFRFTTIKQQTNVEVVLPGAYSGRQSPLSLLAGPITRTDPADSGNHFDCA
jgi:hypothetical protein